MLIARLNSTSQLLHESLLQGLPFMSETALFAHTSLADLFQRCSSSFKELYLALAIYGHISLSNFNDQYGRFGVWGIDSGADRIGRGSLDDSLRDHPNQKSIISEILVDLRSDLEKCKLCFYK